MTEARPRRVQLSRAKGWRMPSGTVKVDRSTKLGNPFRVRFNTLDGHRIYREINKAGAPLFDFVANCPFGAREALAVAFKRCREMIAGWTPTVRQAFDTEMAIELRGKNLGCGCPLPAPGEPDLCHAAVLLELANREE